MNQQRKGLRVRLAASIALIWLTACAPQAETPRTIPQTDFISTDGTPLTPSALKGRAVLVNFWSSTCPVCLKEMPLLQTAHSQWHSEGLTIIAVAMPYDRPSDAVELKTLRGWDFAVAIDPQSVTSKAFGDIREVPATFLYDASGRLVWNHRGEITQPMLDDNIRKALRDAQPRRSS